MTNKIFYFTIIILISFSNGIIFDTSNANDSLSNKNVVIVSKDSDKRSTLESSTQVDSEIVKNAEPKSLTLAQVAQISRNDTSGIITETNAGGISIKENQVKNSSNVEIIRSKESSNEREKMKQTKIDPNTNSKNEQKILSSDNKTSSISDNSIELIRPIRIIYDDSFLRPSLQGSPNTIKKQILHLVSRADSMMRSFIRVRPPVGSITIKKNMNDCQGEGTRRGPVEFLSKYFSKSVEVEADLVIFLRAYHESSSSAKAAAAPCRSSSFEPSKIGTLTINLANMEDDLASSSPVRAKIALDTIFHELLHVVAFHSSIMNNVKSKITTQSPSLYKLRNISKDLLVNGAHWFSDILTSDLMTESIQIDKTLTAASLEYIQIAREGYVTNFSRLPSNSMIESISNFSELAEYQCKDDQPSIYPQFCSMADAKKGRGRRCHSTFLYVTSCDISKRLRNNCFERKVPKGQFCLDQNASIESFASFGPNSRCFETEVLGAMCLKTSQTKQGLGVDLNKRSFLCDHKDKKFKFSFMSRGETKTDFLICPDPSKVEQAEKNFICPNNCHANGVCIQGKCKCFEDFSEKDNCMEKLGEDKTLFSTFYDLETYDNPLRII